MCGGIWMRQLLISNRHLEAQAMYWQVFLREAQVLLLSTLVRLKTIGNALECTRSYLISIQWGSFLKSIIWHNLLEDGETLSHQWLRAAHLPF